MKKYRYFLLTVIIVFFTLFFFATKKYVPCEGDCEKMSNFNQAIRNGRDSYVVWAIRCGPNPVSDTICIFVKDISGINWGLLADTACTIATQYGLNQQKIFILKNFSSPVDTLAKKQCP